MPDSRARGRPSPAMPSLPTVPGLSPTHLRRAPFVARLVLRSPNGAATAAAAPPNVRVVAACLRDITAVGSWLIAHG
jgi:2-phosphosulfolactate phosphatase